MGVFNIDRADLYKHRVPELQERTKNRLTEISEMGMEEVGVAQFGIPGLVSGLYIERVWSYNETDWADYINWVKSLQTPKTT